MSHKWGLRSVAVALLGVSAACTRGEQPAEEAPQAQQGSNLGPVERLNVQPGNLARFTFPYYTAIQALPGGGAVAVWMRQERPFRPLVYRRAADAAGPFGEERYLGSEPFKQTISVVPSLARGPDNGTLYAAWQARKPTSGDKLVVFRRSDDGGETWGEERTVNHRLTSFIPSMAADPDGAVYVAWTDERDRKRRIFFNRSLDRGATWLAEEVILDMEAEPDRGGAVSVALASDGAGRVAIVWERQLKRGRSILAAGSNDRGTTWSPVVRVDDDDVERFSPTAPRVAFVGGRIMVAWMAAATNKAAHVWSDSSADGGRTWGADVLVHGVEGGIPPNIELASDGKTGHLFFNAGPYAGPWRIYHARVGSDGTWAALGDAVTPVSAGEGKFANPRVATGGGGRLALTYVQDRKRIFFAESRDGKSWGPGALVYEVGPELKDATARYPQVSVADGVAYVLWEVWADRAGVYKTLADGEEQLLPADIFVRRVTLAQ